jgi:hypothetical protein
MRILAHRSTSQLARDSHPRLRPASKSQRKRSRLLVRTIDCARIVHLLNVDIIVDAAKDKVVGNAKSASEKVKKVSVLC